MPFKVAELQGGGEGVVEATPRVPSGNQPVKSVPDRNPACFCRKIQAGIDAEVYRKSTVDRAVQDSTRGSVQEVSSGRRL